MTNAMTGFRMSMSGARVWSWGFGAAGIVLTVDYFGRELLHHAMGSTTADHRCGLSQLAVVFWVLAVGGALSLAAVGFGVAATLDRMPIPARRKLELCILAAPALAALAMALVFLTRLIGL